MSNALAMIPVREVTTLAGDVRSILLASDLSAASQQAFAHARFLAEALGARLTLYHAVATGPASMGIHRSQAQLAARRAEIAALRRLTAAATAVESPHVVAIDRAVTAAEAVVRRIEATAPDLAVLAKHGHHGVAELSLGGVAEAVLRHVRRPVLWVPGSPTGAAYGYRRILVPTSLTLSSRRAFPLAARIAAIWQAEVVAVHVVGVPPRRSTACCLPSEEAVRQFFEPEFRGLPVSTRVSVGLPAYQVIQTARSEAVDLIVLSRPTPRGLGEDGIGGDEERIVRQAPCPVLVV